MKVMIMIILMMVIIMVITIGIMIMMIEIILTIAVVIINSPFQPGDFSTGSTAVQCSHCLIGINTSLLLKKLSYISNLI